MALGRVKKQTYCGAPDADGLWHMVLTRTAFTAQYRIQNLIHTSRSKDDDDDDDNDNYDDDDSDVGEVLVGSITIVDLMTARAPLHLP